MAKDRQQYESKWHWSRKRINENIGLILTAIATLAAILAWNEARLARQLDERAYVGVEFDRFEFDSDAKAFVKLIAFGRTPPLDVRFNIQCTTEAAPSRKHLKLIGTTIPLGVFYSDSPFTSKSTGCPNRNIDHSNKGWVYGIVQYQDLFGKSHSTEFCFSSALPADSQKGTDWEPCPDFINKLT